MSSLLFQSYEQEIVSLLGALGEKKVVDSAYLESLGEIEALVRQLDLESRNNASTTSGSRQRVQQLKETVQHLKEKAEREALHYSATAAAAAGERIENFDEENFDVLDRTSETLLGATRSLYETEEVATGIGQDLLHQRATLLSAKEKVFTFSSLLGLAQRSMRSLQDVEVRQRAVAYGAVAFCFLLLFIYVITALSKHAPGPSPTLAPT
ncbi:hypothetical protein BASA81_004857 [Batrachochytrium salamandrivorans]|nr:hypothetical protein BASA81_004857 [Batrachochytrium salamandrivorans]